MLIVLATSPRVAPGLLSWPAWDALRSAAAVLAQAGHPLLPALDEAGIGYREVEGEPEAGSLPADGDVMWLPEPGDAVAAGEAGLCYDGSLRRGDCDGAREYCCS